VLYNKRKFIFMQVRDFLFEKKRLNFLKESDKKILKFYK